MKSVYFIMALTVPLCARHENVDHIKKKILHRLALPDKTLFQEFFHRYDTLVNSFLDTRNNEPLSEHVHAMQSELKTLKAVCQDIRFAAVHEYIQPYYQQVSKMVHVLAGYIHSDNSWGLALQMREFKFLLPDHVASQGDLYLLGALKHRLSCRKRHQNNTR